MPRVSVIVPIFNGTAYLPLFFESLAGALPEGSEVILVDDASTERVWDTVPELPRAASVRRLSNRENVGYAATVNRGFAKAGGDVIVQLNTDLVLMDKCIAAMVDLISRESRVGIVGSKLIYPTNGLVQHVGMAFGNFTKRRIFSELPPDHSLCRTSRETQIVSGATVAMSARTLSEVGPLDEAYYNRNEDIEHCLLARRKGLRNFMCADSVAYHWRSQSGPARFARIAEGDSLFWSRWGSSIEADLGHYVDEALDHVVSEMPGLDDAPLRLLDLSRGGDQPIVQGRLEERWHQLDTADSRFRQMNNSESNLRLPLLLPAGTAATPVPFVYLVDSYRELEENTLWFEERAQTVGDELVVDTHGVAMRTGALAT